MYDSSARWQTSRAAARSAVPAPGEYSPPASIRPARPSAAPFGSSARRAPPTSRVPLPTQYLGHADIASAVRAAAAKSAPPFDSSAARWGGGEGEYTPGPAAYNPADAHARAALAATFSQAARPVSVPLAGGDARPASPPPRRFAPSIPCARDYGYDVTGDGLLAPQTHPNAARAPPAPGSYSPRRADEPRRAAAVGFAHAGMPRTDFARMHDASVPGPGAYEAPTAADATSTRAATPAAASAFRSATRRGVEAFVARPATGTRVGPGTHYNEEANTAFRPPRAASASASASSKRGAQSFGTTTQRFEDAAAAAAGGSAGSGAAPGAYALPSDIDATLQRALTTSAHMRALSASRQSRARPRTSEAGGVGALPALSAGGAPSRSRSPSAATGGGEAGAHAHDAAHTTTPLTHRLEASLPAPAFTSSAPRFAPSGRWAAPGAGSYFPDLLASSTAASHNRAAPPFASSVSRASSRGGGSGGGGGGGGGGLLRVTATPAGVGPGAYDVDAFDAARRGKRLTTPSATFRTVANRDPLAGGSGGGGGGGGGADTFLAYDTAPKSFVRRASHARSAKLGRFDALAPPRSPPFGRSFTPGPGAYDTLAPVPLMRDLRGAAAAQAAGSGGPFAPAQPQPGGSHFMKSGVERMSGGGSGGGAPGPGAYQVASNHGLSLRRTFNVGLAVNEHRALLRNLPVQHK